jgi:predicted PurR-regulated permease PerM
MTKQLIVIGSAVMTTLLAILLFWQFRIVTGYVLLSLLLASALRPLIKHLAGRTRIQLLFWILIYLTVFGLFLTVIVMTAQLAITEIELLASTIAVQSEWNFPVWLHGSTFQQILTTRLPPPDQLFEALTGDQGQHVLPVILGFTQGVGGAISDILVIVFLSIYWSISHKHFERLWLSLLPSSLRKQAREIWRTIEVNLGAYLRSELVQSCVAGLLLGLGYWLLGSPYPALLGISGAVIWLIPVVGAPLALVLPIFLGLLTSVQLAVVTTLYTLIVLVSLQIWVEPRLFKRKWDNPILTLIILLALANDYGLPGILVAPPISVVCQILWDRLFIHPVVHGEAIQISDLQDRQARVWETLREMDAPPMALVTSSMDRLTKLIDRVEPVVSARVIVDPVDPNQLNS